jgi:uncharacterized protein involved in outer membrane biogenesis
VVAAAAGLVALAWAGLALLFPPARVRAIVQAQLARSLTREVRFSGAGLGLFPPVRLTVQGLAMSEAGGFANGTMFQCRDARLDLDVLQLLSQHIVVKRLALDDAGLHVVLEPDGHTNLEGIVRPTPAQPGAKPMDFTIDEFALRRRGSSSTTCAPAVGARSRSTRRSPCRARRGAGGS